MNKVIDKCFRSCRFVSTIVKHPVYWFHTMVSSSHFTTKLRLCPFNISLYEHV